MDAAHESDGHRHAGKIFEGHGDEEQEEVGNTFNIADGTEILNCIHDGRLQAQR